MNAHTGLSLPDILQIYSDKKSSILCGLKFRCSENWDLNKILNIKKKKRKTRQNEIKKKKKKNCKIGEKIKKNRKIN